MKYFSFIFFLCCFQILSSQTSTSFNLSKQYFVKGDATVIGNTILSKFKKKSFNDKLVINDLVKMKYVDIDNDKSTFSSSEATLNIPENTKKIVNATLYWSAIYSFNRGVKKRKGNRIVYRGNNVRNSSIQKIKFKIPNNNYQEIEGTILFDGYKKSKNTDNAPYVCFLDVTDIISKNKNINGAYTVANINATQGYTSGGSSGGWLLHIVYETENATPKYINTYNGISTINKTPLNINLKGFKTVKKGIVKASLTLSALEGDSGLGKDQCLIYNKGKEKFTLLENNLRPSNNFFNGSITKNEKNFKDRVPYNINNLGFDIVEMDVPNHNNEIINNETTSLLLRFQTKSDRFHLFFASFKTEVDNVFFEAIKESKNAKKEEIVVKDKKFFKDTTLIVEKETDLLLDKITSLEESNKKEISIRKNITVNNLQPGYYIVSNVFSKPSFANRWVTFLKSKNYNPITFLNPENKWQYVSIYNNLDRNRVVLKLEQLKKNQYFKDLWIQKVNLN